MDGALILRLRRVLLVLLPSAAALLAGLWFQTLRTGRIDPLDWLWPCLAALALLHGLLARSGSGAGGRSAAFILLAAMAVPPLLFIALAASSLPWAGMTALLVGLGGSLWGLRWVTARPTVRRWLGLGLWCGVMIAGMWLVQGGVGARVLPASQASPPIAMLTALPLDADADAAISGRTPDLLAGFEVTAPLLDALRPLQLRLIDALDARSLADAPALLLAQPRQLHPAELVALDTWVRAGGHVVILADPLLRWPDIRPLGDPQRAPLTSLLDPLLRHWGLVLEPAQIGGGDPIERRWLDGGALIQLASSSAFTRMEPSDCTLAEDGLVATCRIGQGSAILVADADWIDDRLWTLDPERSGDRRHWTSDAIPILAQMLRNDAEPLRLRSPWLKSEQALISGLRWALLAALILAVGTAIRPRRPILSHRSGRSTL